MQARFLDKLDFPSQESADDSGLDIGHWHIAAMPFLTLSPALPGSKTGHYQEIQTENLSESWAVLRRGVDTRPRSKQL